MEPGDARWLLVSRGELRLSAAEIAEGWHFCQDFDLDLVGPGVGPQRRCRWCSYSVDDYRKLLAPWRQKLLSVLDERAMQLEEAGMAAAAWALQQSRNKLGADHRTYERERPGSKRSE